MQSKLLPVELWCWILQEAFIDDYDTILSIRLTSELFKAIADFISIELSKQLNFKLPDWQRAQRFDHFHSSLFCRLVKNEAKRLNYSNLLIKKLESDKQYEKSTYPLTQEKMAGEQVGKMDFRLFADSSQKVIMAASQAVRNIDFDSALVTVMDRYMFPKDLGAYLMSAVNLRSYEALAVLWALIREEYPITVSLKRIRGAIFYHAAAFYQDYEFERLLQYFPVKNINLYICFRYPHDYFAGSFISRQTNKYERLLDVAVNHQNQSVIAYLYTLGASPTPRQAFR